MRRAVVQVLLAPLRWSHHNQRYWHAVATSQGERAGPVSGERGWVSSQHQSQSSGKGPESAKGSRTEGT